ncbi:MAG: hypothetical protein IPL32_04325 [Chloracidobacterium sp.]|nr:hypothetical protein [Chloracidobacterium sp.]
MKKYQTLLFAACVALFSFSTFAQSPQLIKRTITKTDIFEFGSGGTLAITGAPNGSIRIAGTNKNEIEITAEIELQAANEADIAKLAAVTSYVTDEMRGRTGIISYGTYNKIGDKKLWKKFPKNLLNLPMRIDYVIKVPRYCDLEIDGGKGDLSISGVEGSMRINFLETDANIAVIGGATNITVGSGKVNVALGTKGWRGRSADINLGTGDLKVKLPSNISAEIDAAILKTGAIENTVPDLKPRSRKVPFTDKSIEAKAGVGGAPLKFTVGDGTLKMETLESPL